MPEKLYLEPYFGIEIKSAGYQQNKLDAICVFASIGLQTASACPRPQGRGRIYKVSKLARVISLTSFLKISVSNIVILLANRFLSINLICDSTALASRLAILPTLK